MGAKSSKADTKVALSLTTVFMNAVKACAQGIIDYSINADHVDKSVFSLDEESKIVKLSSSTNIISWKIQIGTTLIHYGLFKFLDGTHPAPSPTEPAYVSWVRQDKLLCDSLIMTLDPTIVHLVSRAQTSKEIWDTLTHTYTDDCFNRSLTHGQKESYKLTTKGPHSITQFMQGVKLCVDVLAIFGDPLDPQDVTNKILDSLDSTFQEVIDSVRARPRDQPISFDELFEKLLESERTTKSQPINWI